MVALSCRFALDIFTVAQQDQPHPEPNPLAHDPGCDLWFWGAASVGLLADSTGGRVGLLKLPLSLNDPGSPGAMVDLLAFPCALAAI